MDMLLLYDNSQNTSYYRKLKLKVLKKDRKMKYKNILKIYSYINNMSFNKITVSVTSYLHLFQLLSEKYF